MTRPFKKRPNPNRRLIIIVLILSVFLYHWGLFIGYLMFSDCECNYPIANKIEIDFKIPPDTTHLKIATTYNTEISQCDSTPNHTADGSYIDPVKLKSGELRWVALSRDLIWDDYRQTIFSDTTHWRGQWKFGDTIEVYSKKFPKYDGKWVVHDCKSDTCKMSIDFLMHPLNNRPKLGVGRDVKIIMCSDQY